MTRTRLKNIIRGLTQAGSLFPHQIAFTLLIPLRALLLSPAELLRRLHPTADSSILEVGCGPGYFSSALARAVPQGELVLADIQPEMLTIARRRLEKRHITNTTSSCATAAASPLRITVSTASCWSASSVKLPSAART